MVDQRNVYLLTATLPRDAKPRGLSERFLSGDVTRPATERLVQEITDLVAREQAAGVEIIDQLDMIGEVVVKCDAAFAVKMASLPSVKTMFQTIIPMGGPKEGLKPPKP